MNTRIFLLIPSLLSLLIITACGPDEGPDALSTRTVSTSETVLECSDCHAVALTSRRQIFGTGGDFGANPGQTSHHIAGLDDPTTAQCRVCHELSAHTQGTVLLRHADSGAAIRYNPANPSSLEPFCLSCHDPLGATTTSIGADAYEPFGDGEVLGLPPYPYATRIADSWSKAYGHGPNGNHSPADRLTCMGNGQPGTGCHGNNGTINAHGSVSQVLAAREFEYDIGTYVELNFDLCFNCHSSYAGVTKEDTFGVLAGGILDDFYGPGGPNIGKPPYYTSGVTTHFADHNDPSASPYNDDGAYTLGPVTSNLQWFHIGIQGSALRGTITDSGIHCVNCHDVHGSNSPYGAVYDEIGYTNIFPDPVNILGKMDDANYGSNLLGNNPTYCSFNCHRYQPITNAWFEPIIEQ